MPNMSNRTLAAAVLAAVATALVLGAVVLFVRRDDNAPIQVLLPTPAQSGAAAGIRDGNPSSAEPGRVELRVYVSGAVRNSGVYTLQPDDRLSDAIAAAGGATGDAELAAVNLARRVKDEEHYYIPRVGETPPPGSALAGENAQGAGPAATASCGGLIELNAASADLLETLPGIGQVRAEAIVSYRERNGPFQSVEEITNVPGIGPATYDKVRELAAVCNGP